MIRSIQNHALSAAVQTAQARKTSTAAADFRKALTSAAATPAATTPGKPANTEPARLGPFTADPNTHPATPPPQSPAAITASPWMPPGSPGDQNLMNRTEHEATMNAWLKNYTGWSNAQKTQIYDQAMINWQLNNQRCQELGLASPPQPAPPALDSTEAMPTGWWFQS